MLEIPDKILKFSSQTTHEILSFKKKENLRLSLLNFVFASVSWFFTVIIAIYIILNSRALQVHGYVCVWICMGKWTRSNCFKEVSNKKRVGFFVKVCRPISNDMKIETNKQRNKRLWSLEDVGTDKSLIIHDI